jgi:hypothetical protein
VQQQFLQVVIDYTYINIYHMNLYLTLWHFKAAMRRLTWPPARAERDGPCTLGI